MKIHKQGGQVIYEGKSVIKKYNCKGLNGGVVLTENLSASDKRRKLLTVELTESEILECVDKLGCKIMPQWMVKIMGWFK